MDKSTVRERVWGNCVAYEPDGCWLWQGALSNLGYGSIKIDGRGHGVHRLAYWLANDEMPEPECMHLCDVRNCVNPAHLRAGTHAENMADMVSKGRAIGFPNPGERNGRAKLTDDDVREMRLHYAAGGVSYAQLARKYGVSVSAAQFAITKKTWAHLE